MSAIRLADAPALRRFARRTVAVRAALAAAAVGLVVGVVLLDRHPRSRTIQLLPTHASAIVALDLSASISADTFGGIGRTLADLARSGSRFGLVVFSDTAYEALPLGAPSSALAPLVRYFTLPKQTTPGYAPTFPVNPWQATFSAGTRISAGLALAHDLAVAQPGRKPTVVLLSDLDDSPGDLARLTAVALSYRRDGIPLQVVGLNTSLADAAFFQRLLGPGNAVIPFDVNVQTPPPRTQGLLEWWLVALVVLAAAVLGAGELWGARLSFSRGGAR